MSGWTVDSNVIEDCDSGIFLSGRQHIIINNTFRRVGRHGSTEDAGASPITCDQSAPLMPTILPAL